MQMLLDGKVAIVTGGGDPSGLGASFATALAEAGAAVMIADINEAGARAVAGALSAKGLNVSATPVDVASEASVGSMVDATVKDLGGVDILVNNAALVAELTRGIDLIDCPPDEWRRVLDVNVSGTLNCCRAAIPRMRERGGGKIVNMSSGGAFRPLTAYSVSKLAIVSMTAILADQHIKDNIRVNALAPGLVETGAGLIAMPSGSPARDRFSATMRPGVPKDLHGALLLLTSEAGDWITGQTLNIDGGWIKRL